MARKPALPRSLGVRLAVAFVAVAVAAVAAVAGLTLLSARTEVSTLIERQRAATTETVVASLEQAYAQAGSWQRVDLRPAQTLVVAAPATLQIRSATEQVISTGRLDMANMMARMHSGPLGDLGPPRSARLAVDGERIGTALLRFPADGLPVPEAQLRSALARNVLLGAAVAALLASVVALVATRRITRPVTALTTAIRSYEGGDPKARVDADTDIRELEQLGRAFNRMATTLDRREHQQRVMAADVAHELRTPTAILQGTLESLLDGVEQPTRDRLSSLHDEVLRLRRSVEDLESLSAAESSELTVARKRVDLADVAAGAADALRPQFAAAGVELHSSLEPSWANGDPVRLSQLVTNLLTNAVKFTPHGGHVELSVAHEVDWIELRVRDSGAGVAPDDAPHLFERFWRGRNSHNVSGSGIGLAIVAGIARAHNGDAQVVSDPGEGATFIVRIPSDPRTPVH